MLLTVMLTVISACTATLQIGNITGQRSVLVVHLIAADRRCSVDSSRLSDSIFGTHGDVVTMTSQYAACSHNRLTFTAFRAPGVIDGVIETRLSINATGLTLSALRNATENALRTQIGVTNFARVNHIMYCFPPSTPGLEPALGDINGRGSMFDGDMITSVTGQMHEIGHNLQMNHATLFGSTNDYGDHTDIMSISYSGSNSPRKCFNAAHLAFLGWYADCTVTFDPRRNTRILVVVQSIGRFRPGVCPPSTAVVVRITTGQSKDIFFAFNEVLDPVLDTDHGNTLVVVSGVSDPTSVGVRQRGRTERITVIPIGAQYITDSVPTGDTTQVRFIDTAIRITFCRQSDTGGTSQTP